MQNLDWGHLGFAVRETNGVLVSRYKDGKWTEPARETGPMELSPYSLVLNYSTCCFEGLKAFRGAERHRKLQVGSQLRPLLPRLQYRA